ncbi:DedD protein [Nitrosospira multiformis]|uniref:DedD protein n=1 Tax=Nitrosospira multiformis TaxID=1231 RepID=A0A1H8HI08_9PROT|nr:SPOR domain-containing protein [Nitrosospira multiformis]SEN55862.1 DedD protein [Nitrosospira multiformis]
MAKTITEEEIQLRKRARRRLVGAIVLATAAVVVLPMILDSKPDRRGHEIDIHIPSEDSVEELAAESAFPVNTPPAAASSMPQAEGGAEQADGISGKNIMTVPPRETPASINEKASASPAPAAPRSGATATNTAPAASRAEMTSKNAPPVASREASFVVQLGAFSTSAKAARQSEKIASQNFSAYTEIVKSGKEEVTRVRVGPFATREEAEKTREKLKNLGFEGVVTEK